MWEAEEPIAFKADGDRIATDVIESLVLPIGMYSTEVQEARNKDNRQYRLSPSRKRPEKAQCKISLTIYSSAAIPSLPASSSLISTNPGTDEHQGQAPDRWTAVSFSEMSVRGGGVGSHDHDDYDPV